MQGCILTNKATGKQQEWHFILSKQAQEVHNNNMEFIKWAKNREFDKVK